MATSSKGSNDLDDGISKSASKLLVTGDDDSEFMFYQTRVKIQDHFKNIHKSAQELESKLLNELDEYAEMHRNMLQETNSVIEQMIAMLNTLTDTQIKKNLYNNIDLLNKQKYINIDVNVDHFLSDFINTTISINIEMASDSNIAKVLSYPHSLMHYSKQKEMISLETLDAQFNEIKTFLAEPKYLEQGNTWYLIGRNWVEKWLNYEDNVEPVDGLIPIPPPIDNSDIMDETESHGLKYYREYKTIHVHKDNECIEEELEMGRDFVIFNEAAWVKLVEWYGIKEDTIIFPRPILPRDHNDIKRSVGIQNVSLCLYPNYDNARFKLFTSYYKFRYLTKEIRFFEHDTEPEIQTAVKRVLGIPLSSEIIIFYEDNSGTRIHPITSKKYTVISSMDSCDSFLFFTVPIYLVAVKSKETEWLYV